MQEKMMQFAEMKKRSLDALEQFNSLWRRL